MATPTTVKGRINQVTGVSSWRKDTRSRQMQDAIATFSQDRRTNKPRAKKGWERAMSNAKRRRSLGGNGG